MRPCSHHPLVKGYFTRKERKTHICGRKQERRTTGLSLRTEHVRRLHCSLVRRASTERSWAPAGPPLPAVMLTPRRSRHNQHNGAGGGGARTGAVAAMLDGEKERQGERGARRRRKGGMEEGRTLVGSEAGRRRGSKSRLRTSRDQSDQRRIRRVRAGFPRRIVCWAARDRWHCFVYA